MPRHFARQEHNNKTSSGLQGPHGETFLPFVDGRVSKVPTPSNCCFLKKGQKQNHLVPLLSSTFPSTSASISHPILRFLQLWFTLIILLSNSSQTLLLSFWCSFFLLEGSICSSRILKFNMLGFPGGSVVKNLPANAGDTWSRKACWGITKPVPQPLSLHSRALELQLLSPPTTSTEAHAP